MGRGVAGQAAFHFAHEGGALIGTQTANEGDAGRSRTYPPPLAPPGGWIGIGDTVVITVVGYRWRTLANGVAVTEGRASTP